MSGGRIVYSTDGGERDRPKPSKPPKPRGRKPAPSRSAAPAGLRPDTIYVERQRKGRGGKTVTLVLNLPGPEASRQALLKDLKASCGAGGTLKDGVLEVQGDHRDRLLDYLAGRGYTVKPRGG
jgi:translation initiation factor 1